LRTYVARAPVVVNMQAAMAASLMGIKLLIPAQGSTVTQPLVFPLVPHTRPTVNCCLAPPSLRPILTHNKNPPTNAGGLARTHLLCFVACYRGHHRSDEPAEMRAGRYLPALITPRTRSSRPGVACLPAPVLPKPRIVFWITHLALTASVPRRTMCVIFIVFVMRDEASAFVAFLVVTFRAPRLLIRGSMVRIHPGPPMISRT
jgi:hypothetical protein